MTPSDESIERKRRLALNQALFRELNEQLKKLRRTLTRQTAALSEYQCECSNIGCDETVPLALEEYEQVRRVSTHFFVAPGHELPEVERVVAETDRYYVVEKIGVAAQAVAQLDRGL